LDYIIAFINNSIFKRTENIHSTNKSYLEQLQVLADLIQTAEIENFLELLLVLANHLLEVELWPPGLET
jgi:hypothetical protein